MREKIISPTKPSITPLEMKVSFWNFPAIINKSSTNCLLTLWKHSWIFCFSSFSLSSVIWSDPECTCINECHTKMILSLLHPNKVRIYLHKTNEQNQNKDLFHFYWSTNVVYNRWMPYETRSSCALTIWFFSFHFYTTKFVLSISALVD